MLHFKNKPVSAVIFDMDGVIIDSEPIYQKIEQSLFTRYGLTIKKEEHHTFVGMPGVDMWQKIIDKYKIPYRADCLTKETIDEIINNIKNQEDLKPIEGFKELFYIIKKNNIKTAVASSSPRELIHIILSKLNIINDFDIIVSGEEVENGKPLPDIFIKVAELINVDTRNCLVIEDSQNGVIAAKAAGMNCIGYRNLNSGTQNLNNADMIISDFIEIINTIYKSK